MFVDNFQNRSETTGRPVKGSKQQIDFQWDKIRYRVRIWFGAGIQRECLYEVTRIANYVNCGEVWVSVRRIPSGDEMANPKNQAVQTIRNQDCFLQ